MSADQGSQVNGETGKCPYFTKTEQSQIIQMDC